MKDRAMILAEELMKDFKITHPSGKSLSGGVEMLANFIRAVEPKPTTERKMNWLMFGNHAINLDNVAYIEEGNEVVVCFVGDKRLYFSKEEIKEKLKEVKQG